MMQTWCVWIGIRLFKVIIKKTQETYIGSIGLQGSCESHPSNLHELGVSAFDNGRKLTQLFCLLTSSPSATTQNL